jgi:hypothetical protein
VLPRTETRHDGALSVVVAAVSGAVLAVAAAWAYYDDAWRALGHVLGPWVFLVFLLSVGRTEIWAVVRAVTTLATAVLVFYVAQKVGHDIRWAGADSTMSVNWDKVTTWEVLAVLGGAVLGWASARSVRPHWSGAAAAAVVVSLPLAEGAREALVGGGWEVAAGLDLLLAGVLLWWTASGNRRPVLTACLVGALVVLVAGALTVLASF